MYQGKKILGLITARGGSKGIPRKNVIDVGGKPLIAWTIEAAKESKLLDRVVLSSDNDEIIQVAASWGCEVPFKRAADLSGDAASSADVVKDCLQRVPGYDYVVLLQPTSPLRRACDIDQAIKICIDNKAPACVSMCESNESPFWMYSIGHENRLEPVVPSNYNRRQELPKIFSLNGAVYIANAQWFIRHGSFISDDTLGYEMPRKFSLDIDDLEDLRLLRLALQLGD